MILKFAQKYLNNDLWKFFLTHQHRCIDKWLNYFEVYDKWFGRYRDKDITFVEIGVQNGGSIQMWKKYFGKNVKIIGIDIDSRCKQFEEEQITIEIGSQEDVDFWNKFKLKYPKIDILLDDGGHTMRQQIITFQCMFPHIQDGGIYMCEDIHTSYEKNPLYNGGDFRDSANNYMGFAKTLVDELNAIHSNGAIPVTQNTLTIGGLHFYDNMVVIEKEIKHLRPMSLRLGEMGKICPFEDTIPI